MQQENTDVSFYYLMGYYRENHIEHWESEDFKKIHFFGRKLCNFLRLWNSACYRVTVDGGATVWHKILNNTNHKIGN